MIDIRFLTLAGLTGMCPPSIQGDPEIQAMNAALYPQIAAAATATDDANVLARISVIGRFDILDAVARNFNLHRLSFWGDLITTSKQLALAGILAHQRRSGTVGAVKRIFPILLCTGSVVEWWQEAASPHTYRIEADASLSPYDPGDIEDWIAEWCDRFARRSQRRTGLVVTP